MKFTKLVRNNNIHWPTHRKFSREKWIEEGEKSIEDPLDRQIYEVGLWADTSLSFTRTRINSLSIWNLPTKELARLLLALANSDTKIIMDKLKEVSSTHQTEPLVSHDEIAYQTIEDDLWGSRKSSSILDSLIDAVDSCLKYSAEGNKLKEKSNAIDLKEAKGILNFAGIYRATENIYYDVLWLESSMQERDKYWELLPKDLDKEAILAASLRRHEELLAQIFASAGELWRKNRTLAKSTIKETNLNSLYQIQNKNGHLFVKFMGKEGEETPPISYLFKSVVAQLYYWPLINTPLDSLEKFSILDLLSVFVELRQIANAVFEGVDAQQKKNKSITEVIELYCPLINRSSVVKAISESLQTGREETSRLVDILTWTKDKPSIYHCPLVNMNTEKGLCLFFAFHPILSINPYWLVDHWLSRFGVSLEWRGNLFEEQIYKEVNLSLLSCKFKDFVKIFNGIKITAKDGSIEELDIIVKIGDTVVIGEAKCQKFPITVLDRANYLKTLENASEQINRKVGWAKEHLAEFASILSVGEEEIKTLIPLIITNHSIGVGLNINNVPVLDLLLFENYFSRPFHATGISSEDGIIEMQGKPFYSNPEEFSENFSLYATYPHPIQTMLKFLKPIIAFMPLTLDKPLGIIEFVIDIDNPPHNNK